MTIHSSSSDLDGLFLVDEQGMVGSYSQSSSIATARVEFPLSSS